MAWSQTSKSNYFFFNTLSQHVHVALWSPIPASIYETDLQLVNINISFEIRVLPNSSGRLLSLFPSKRSVRRWLWRPVYTLGSRKSLFLRRSSQVKRGKQSKKSSGRLVNSFPSKYRYWKKINKAYLIYKHVWPVYLIKTLFWVSCNTLWNI